MKKENTLIKVLEEVTFTLNEIRKEKLKKLEESKLSTKQEKIILEIERDLEISVTKLGLLLHLTEL